MHQAKHQPAKMPNIILTKSEMKMKMEKKIRTHTHTRNYYKIITYKKTSDECQRAEVDNGRFIAADRYQIIH